MKKYIFPFIIISSLAVIGLAIILDPFSIPFPDWNDMPEQQKQLYLQQSKTYTYLKYIGFLGLFIGIFGSAYYFIKKPKQSVKNEN